MNFEKFVKKEFTAENYDIEPIDAAELAWSTCKREVLKVLNRHCNSHIPVYDDSLRRAMKEIEKL